MALAEHGDDAAQVSSCTLDMSKAYIAGAAAHLPNAALCCDPFHRVKLANEVLETVRRDEVDGSPALKRTRFRWLKDAVD